MLGQQNKEALNHKDRELYSGDDGIIKIAYYQSLELFRDHKNIYSFSRIIIISDYVFYLNNKSVSFVQ